MKKSELQKLIKEELTGKVRGPLMQAHSDINIIINFLNKILKGEKSLNEKQISSVLSKLRDAAIMLSKVLK